MTSTEQQRVEEIAKGLEAILPRHAVTLAAALRARAQQEQTI